jgi:hypothetical protein
MINGKFQSHYHRFEQQKNHQPLISTKPHIYGDQFSIFMVNGKFQVDVTLVEQQ